jgi:hypothetical protein
MLSTGGRGLEGARTRGWRINDPSRTADRA